MTVFLVSHLTRGCVFGVLRLLKRPRQQHIQAASAGHVILEEGSLYNPRIASGSVDKPGSRPVYPSGLSQEERLKKRLVLLCGFPLDLVQT